jgi:hypothetical protein
MDIDSIDTFLSTWYTCDIIYQPRSFNTETLMLSSSTWINCIALRRDMVSSEPFTCNIRGRLAAFLSSNVLSACCSQENGVSQGSIGS